MRVERGVRLHPQQVLDQDQEHRQPRHHHQDLGEGAGHKAHVMLHHVRIMYAGEREVMTHRKLGPCLLLVSLASRRHDSRVNMQLPGGTCTKSGTSVQHYSTEPKPSFTQYRIQNCIGLKKLLYSCKVSAVCTVQKNLKTNKILHFQNCFFLVRKKEQNYFEPKHCHHNKFCAKICLKKKFQKFLYGFFLATFVQY